MSNKDKLYTITEKIQDLLNEVEEVADDLDDNEKPKTKFLVCKSPKNGHGGGIRYRIKDNSAPCEVVVYSNPDSNGVYIGEHGSPNDPGAYVLDSELIGLRDLLTHLIAKRGVK